MKIKFSIGFWRLHTQRGLTLIEVALALFVAAVATVYAVYVLMQSQNTDQLDKDGQILDTIAKAASAYLAASPIPPAGVVTVHLSDLQKSGFLSKSAATTNSRGQSFVFLLKQDTTLNQSIGLVVSIPAPGSRLYEDYEAGRVTMIAGAGTGFIRSNTSTINGSGGAWSFPTSEWPPPPGSGVMLQPGYVMAFIGVGYNKGGGFRGEPWLARNDVGNTNLNTAYVNIDMNNYKLYSASQVLADEVRWYSPSSADPDSPGPGYDPNGPDPTKRIIFEQNSPVTNSSPTTTMWGKSIQFTDGTTYPMVSFYASSTESQVHAHPAHSSPSEVSFGSYSWNGSSVKVNRSVFTYLNGKALFNAPKGVLSDKRLKTDVHPLSQALEKINRLHGYAFKWKQTGRAGMGLIAQEVEAVYPMAVVTNQRLGGLKFVSQSVLIAPLIESVKTLAEQQSVLTVELQKQERAQKALQRERIRLQFILQQPLTEEERLLCGRACFAS